MKLFIGLFEKCYYETLNDFILCFHITFLPLLHALQCRKSIVFFQRFFFPTVVCSSNSVLNIKHRNSRVPGRRIPIISSTTFWDNVPAIDIQWVQNLWIPSGGGRRYPCRLPFSLFRRELDQCFGSVWTGKWCCQASLLSFVDFSPSPSSPTTAITRRRPFKAEQHRCPYHCL